MGASVTKFAVAIMNWTRPSPVVEFGDDILNPEFAVGNDSPSTQPVEPVVETSSEASPTLSPPITAIEYLLLP